MKPIRNVLTERLITTLADANIVSVGVEIPDYDGRVFIAVPKTEATPEQCGNVLERAGVCRYDDVDEVESVDGKLTPAIALLMQHYHLLSVPMKRIHNKLN